MNWETIRFGVLSGIIAAVICRIFYIRERYRDLLRTSLRVAANNLGYCIFNLNTTNASHSIKTVDKMTAVREIYILDVPDKLEIDKFPLYDAGQDVFWRRYRIWCPFLSRRVRGFGLWKSKQHFQEIYAILREAFYLGYIDEDYLDRKRIKVFEKYYNSFWRCSALY
jgi:hypothetical protein